ncbi:hypothetical protein D3878_15215 [Noviherbaspirillum sedimenti]|uniref:Uncharacterized protein n=1 Tax=Noviherbaspirillum sedimenti TaxID=2320865 RepID=A0A3A3G877_9BURK|nr:hypothetical protein D3878_15215 [Noviherbaspirillum sedimenti]
MPQMPLMLVMAVCLTWINLPSHPGGCVDAQSRELLIELGLGFWVYSLEIVDVREIVDTPNKGLDKWMERLGL